jgi:hypothetical protein
MPKRFYVTPTQYWRLPEATDLATLREEVEQAALSGATLVLDVEFEGILAELTLIGSRLGAFALVDIPLPGAEIVEDVF